ncbi:MAG: adenylyltransferase/cytidyltransferase family protein, partial [Heliobacteriaceae bacterium]|nr:adenylyltransferase/cytidyltransferase family protein [Heliobacteriaceae bacterium]
MISLALGYFDGVHLGHQAVIKNAAALGSKAVAVTFKDHPCCFFYDVCPKYILTREERRRKIEELGVEIYELDFGAIAHLSADEY